VINCKLRTSSENKGGRSILQAGCLKGKRRLYVEPLFVLVLVLFIPVESVAEWSFEIFGGAAYSLPTPLSFQQSGQEDLHVNADYKGEPFNASHAAPYYDWRAGWWKEDRAWEVEWLHHKLILENPPPGVQQFNISNGFNLLTVNRAWAHRGFIYRLGGGAVIAYPYSTVRGKAYPNEGGLFDTGYYLAGPTLQASAEKRFFLLKHFFLALEAKLTLSYARVPIQDGHADVTNAAIHGLFGIGTIF
jgi:hypothetical protein